MTENTKLENLATVITPQLADFMYLVQSNVSYKMSLQQMSDIIELNLTAAEIKVLYESNANTNEYSDAEQTTVLSVENGATADQTDAEIKIAYENNANTNEYSDTEQTTVLSVEDGATQDQTDAEIRAAVEAATDSNVFTDADHTKLNNIETLADVTDAGNVGAVATLDSDYVNSSVRYKNNLGTMTNLVPAAQSILYRGSTTIGAIPIGTQEIIGRLAGGMQAITAAQERTRINVENGATADQSDAEIKTAYESNANTNEFSDAEQTKLAGATTEDFAIAMAVAL